MSSRERYQQLTEQLLAAVQDHLAGGGEVALLRAYDVGRSAVADHLNALEMVALQQEALIRTLVQRIGDEEGAHLTQAAAHVFAESLAPFELVTRSSQEGKALLEHLNGELERQVAERTTELRQANAILRTQVAEEVRLRERLIERERLAAIGTTAAKLAHEIGNPLNGMSIALQLLQRRLSKAGVDDQTRASVNALQSQVSRLSNLLQEFRSLSRRREVTFRPTNLAEVISEVLTTELPLYTEQGITIEKVCDPALPAISADGDKLKQVVLNLCKNAVEAMPDGGTLTVRSSHAGAQAILEVADTGEGIPDGVDIFEPFVTTKAEGTGLGLPVVRQLVAAHGGTLTYRSARGQGTTFTVTLPFPAPERQGNDT